MEQAFSFGEILNDLKIGQRVARAGWNGKGQYVYMAVMDYQVEEGGERATKDFEPCFVIKNAQGKFQPGWVPSISDLLADDWIVAV